MGMTAPMSHHVLISAGHSDAGGTIEARQAFEKLLLLLLTERFWPHGVDESDGPRLEAGDQVLFCLATSRGPELIGDAVVATRSTPLTDQQLAECQLYLGPALPPGRGALTHVATLERARVWEEPVSVVDDGDPAAFELARTLGGVYRTGAVRTIPEVSYRWALSRQLRSDPPPAVVPPRVPAGPADAPWAAPPPRSTPAAPPSQGVPHPPVPEGGDAVRAFLRAYWQLVDFGEPLELMNGSTGGQDIPTPAGPIDFVCRSRTSGDLVAVVCLDGEPPSAVKSTLTHRLAWARQFLAQPGQRVRGMVVVSDPRVQVGDGVDPGVEVRRLQVVCSPDAGAPAPLVTPPAEAEEWDMPGARPFDAPLKAREAVAAPTSVPALSKLPTGGTPKPSATDFATKCLQVPRGGRNGMPARPRR